MLFTFNYFGILDQNIFFQGLIDAHEQFKLTLGEADKEFNAIMALVQEVTRIAQQYGLTMNENPYTTLSAQVSRAICLILLVEYHLPVAPSLAFAQSEGREIECFLHAFNPPSHLIYTIYAYNHRFELYRFNQKQFLISIIWSGFRVP